MTEDLARLQTKSRAESRCVNELLSEKQGLSMKLRDKDEELRGKAKLLEVRMIFDIYWGKFTKGCLEHS